MNSSSMSINNNKLKNIITLFSVIFSFGLIFNISFGLHSPNNNNDIIHHHHNNNNNNNNNFNITTQDYNTNPPHHKISHIKVIHNRTIAPQQTLTYNLPPCNEASYITYFNLNSEDKVSANVAGFKDGKRNMNSPIGSTSPSDGNTKIQFSSIIGGNFEDYLAMQVDCNEVNDNGCYVEFSVGIDYATPLNPPSNLQMKQKTDRSIRIDYNMPLLQCWAPLHVKIQASRIHPPSPPQKQYIVFKDSHSTTGSAVFDNLDPYSTYEISSETVVEATASKPSSSIRVTTNLDPSLPGPPVNLSVSIESMLVSLTSSSSSLSSSPSSPTNTQASALLEWQPSSHPVPTNAPIKEYVIILIEMESSNSKSTMINVANDTHSYRFTDLDPGNYQVRIVAKNKNGEGPASNSTSFDLPDFPPNHSSSASSSASLPSLDGIMALRMKTGLLTIFFILVFMI